VRERTFFSKGVVAAVDNNEPDLIYEAVRRAEIFKAFIRLTGQCLVVDLLECLGSLLANRTLFRLSVDDCQVQHYVSL